MYELGIYAEVGQHCGAGTYPNRGRDMTTHVRRLLKAEPDLLMIEAREYSEATGLATGGDNHLPHDTSLHRPCGSDKQTRFCRPCGVPPIHGRCVPMLAHW